MYHKNNLSVLNKKTIIGISCGTLICIIGIYALILSFGIQTTNIHDTLEIGNSTTYQFDSSIGSHELISITGDKFYVEITSNPLSIDGTTFNDDAHFDWYINKHTSNLIIIKNIGNSNLDISGTLEFSTNPMLYTYHILVIIAGIIIIGFSAGFSRKKLR